MFDQLFSCCFVQQICTNALGTIFGGITLALIALIFGDMLFGVPQVHGHWYFVTETRKARMRRYIGMQVTYKAILQQQGSHLSGSGEKVMDETTDGVATTFDFRKRVRIEISGCVRKRYIFRSEIILHIVEHGRARDTSAIHVLTRRNRDSLGGTFTWTASDSNGRVEWSQWVPAAPSEVGSMYVPRRLSINEGFGRIVYAIGKLLTCLNFFDLRDKRNEVFCACQSLDCTKASPVVVKMLVLGEDKRYYSHGGVDLRGIMRAIWILLTRGERQGASTIEQQCVRTLASDFEYSVRRKLREMVLATVLSRKAPKSRIPHLYLSVAHFGYGMQGLAAACIRLGKDVNSLSPRDAAELIARLKYPQPKNLTAAWQQKLLRRTEHLLNLYEANADRLKVA